ncbi:MAG: hypothetical protein ACXWRZ_10090 [Bdellovibrio sp.]
MDKSSSCDTAHSSNIHVGENCSSIEVLESILSSKCQVFLNKENPDFLNDLKRSARICDDKEAYFHSPEKVLLNENSRIVKVPFQSTVDKGIALVEVDNYCTLLNSSFLTESLQAIFEELFMNAVFDAPREAGSQEDPYPAELLMGDDGNSLIISCLDRYGSLKPEKLLNRILQVEKHGAGQVMNMDTSIGGAGIGSSIIYGCSATLVLGVKPGEFTRVSCVIPLKTSRKKFSDIKKNIHLVIP